MPKTSKLVLHVNLHHGDRRMIEISAVISRLVESLRVDGIQCFYEDLKENRPSEFNV